MMAICSLQQKSPIDLIEFLSTEKMQHRYFSINEDIMMLEHVYDTKDRGTNYIERMISRHLGGLRIRYCDGDIVIKYESRNKEITLLNKTKVLMCTRINNNDMIELMDNLLVIVDRHVDDECGAINDEELTEYFHITMNHMKKLLIFVTELYDISTENSNKIDFTANNKSAI